MEKLQDAGFGKNDRLPVSITIRTANKILINILGAFKATVNVISPRKEVIICNSIIYVSDSFTRFFLSYEIMVTLLITNKNFPTIGFQLPNHQS